MRAVPAILLVLALVACSSVKPLTSEKFPSHAEQVCILESPAPAELGGQEIADLAVKLNSYGGDRKAKLGLAKYARKIGAHVVVNAEFRNVMGAPRGYGRAVRLDDPTLAKSIDACQWY